MRAVFLDYQAFSPSLDLSVLRQTVSKLDLYPVTTPAQVLLRSIDAEIILSNKVILNRAILSQLPHLKLICITATGINNVDIDAARELGIAVTNVSGYAKNSVAQYVFAQLLAYYSQIEDHNNNTRAGQWQASDTFCMHGKGSDELAGKTMGIIGYGALGSKVATIARAFDMRVLIAERPKALAIRIDRVAFEQVISQADIISLHCPQTAETEGLFDKKIFNSMKDSAILINTARGALINNHDLLAALNNNQLAGAILDVLEQEPPPKDHMLLAAQSTKLKITAHIAWASQQAQQALLNLVAANITAFKQDERTNRID
ncbi:D-2-hydroxyacid dehydrogenase [Colwellia sp. MB02u-18]|uniref:D-2-hydroxyacid dehydrogenase n=1 Tax=unclassified Colwellia TaxID=196834 RepID=UPI0015F51997|nr:MULTISPECIES: D-2-hydroxyacid dehydrogenase [unclassified Colwellia]MBA6223143.1 D-2-hydroxyacid dehydrogenase [Colwellia sp. MB3u-45]MBA6267567.1 D-2-hydroxyacid dehydrogenase [Colwellia sp. MB3u-43]MBA6320306.1 D-2-hydroxyacid dehydrogenase [Colwellia sp. MB02u-19]MBA6323065.1 D-2-hydroxyacid dehydrogenase [Colwellia sp. MB02u-18]MBA6330398.1 D-2-hydroxyacid dehydrogenase [Colwellia sp. MB02u-12]